MCSLAADVFIFFFIINKAIATILVLSEVGNISLDIIVFKSLQGFAAAISRICQYFFNLQATFL